MVLVTVRALGLPPQPCAPGLLEQCRGLGLRCQWVGSHGDSDGCDREVWSLRMKTASARMDQLNISSGGLASPFKLNSFWERPACSHLISSQFTLVLDTCSSEQSRGRKLKSVYCREMTKSD